MPSYHYKYVYKYSKSTAIDEAPHSARRHDDDSTRRRRKRYSGSSSYGEESGSRSNESLRPLWLTVNKIDNHYGSESGGYRHRDDDRDHERHHSKEHRARTSRHSRYSDVESEYERAHQNGLGPPSPSSSRPRPHTPPLPSPRPKPHSSVGLNVMSSSMPSYVDAGTSTLDYWYYPTQTVDDPNHPIPVSPSPPYTSAGSLYGCEPSVLGVPTYGLTYCNNLAADGYARSGHTHSPYLGVTIPMVMCTACCQFAASQGYPCLEGLHI